MTSSLFISFSQPSSLGIKRNSESKPLPRIHFAEFRERLLYGSNYILFGGPEGNEKDLWFSLMPQHCSGDHLGHCSQCSGKDGTVCTR